MITTGAMRPRAVRCLLARARRAIGGRGHFGIARKLWIGFGAILAVVCATLIVIGVQLVRVDLAHQWGADYAEPLSAATYEMEINTVESGLAVMKYAKSPDPAHKQRFTSDQADFQRWSKQFQDLARQIEHTELIDNTSQAYEKFARLGQAMIDAKDRERAAAGKFVDALSVFHQKLDDILNYDVQPFGASVRGKAAAEALQDLQANLSEMALFLFSYMEMGADEAWVEVEACGAGSQRLDAARIFGRDNARGVGE